MLPIKHPIRWLEASKKIYSWRTDIGIFCLIIHTQKII